MIPLLRSQLHKLLTYPAGAIALALPLMVTLLLAWVLAKEPSAGAGTVATLRALQVTQVFAVIVGTSVTGQEYADATLRTSLLPCRGAVGSAGTRSGW